MALASGVFREGLTPRLTGAGGRRPQGTKAGHDNAEGMASFGVRVEPTVRLGHVGRVWQVHSSCVRFKSPQSKASALICSTSLRGKGHCLFCIEPCIKFCVELQKPCWRRGDARVNVYLTRLEFCNFVHGWRCNVRGHCADYIFGWQYGYFDLLAARRAYRSNQNARCDESPPVSHVFPL